MPFIMEMFCLSIDSAHAVAALKLALSDHKIWPHVES